jgi:uncharacterized zinc-type alcohol dehydrogenase-like protein
MPTIRAYAAAAPSSLLTPFQVERRTPGPLDVQIDIAYCGICHSDVHQVRDEWGGAMFPMVPGHEIVGRVSAVGNKVRKFKVGDLAGVGCMVDSCRKCKNCRAGLEQHCLAHLSFTYNGTEQDKTTPTFGGYSTGIVVDQSFVLKIKNGQPLERVAPLLCAGITTYSPLKRLGTRKGHRVAVMGLGGLGHMAVKIASAMNAEVIVLSGSPSKKIDAKKLGAQQFVLTSDKTQMSTLTGSLDTIIDTVSDKHDINSLLMLLKTSGTLVLVGASPKPHEIAAFPLIIGRRKIEGSLIGGIAETQEMLDFCAKKKILADVEIIAAKEINSAYERMMKGDVRYRFSIDAKTI